MTEPKPITWTTEETPVVAPVVHTWRLAVQRWAHLSATVLESRDATPADLARAVAALTPEQRAEYEAAVGAVAAERGRR
jgi:hypothetical protein